MPIYLIDKIKQKNNGTFKLMDAKDVVMENGKDVETAINEIQGGGGGTGGTCCDITFATTEDILALFGGSVTPKDELLGIWKFNDVLTLTSATPDQDMVVKNIVFKTLGDSVTRNEISIQSSGGLIYRNSDFSEFVLVYRVAPEGQWVVDEKYKTIIIENVTDITEKEKFTTWLKNNATKIQKSDLVKTWKFNDTISLTPKTYNVNFTCNNKQYTQIKIEGNNYMYFIGSSTELAYDKGVGFEETFFNTIEITSIPDDNFEDLYIFLNTNATKQEEPPKDELIGEWVFDKPLNEPTNWISSHTVYFITFISNGDTFDKMVVQYISEPGFYLYYYKNDVQTLVCDDYRGDTFKDVNYKTIKITDVSKLTNRNEFETWLKEKATKQGGTHQGGGN